MSAEKTGQNAAAPRGRLAIISTYDDLCGIAGYTRHIVQQMQPHLEYVEVFDLDQFLLRSTHRRLNKKGDQLIKSFAKRLVEFDSVNIQLEHGTLGMTVEQIVRRFRWLARASPALSITFHTILEQEEFPWEHIWYRLERRMFAEAIRYYKSYKRNRSLSKKVYDAILAESIRRKVNIIVHTRRDARLLGDVYGLPNVRNHPLSYISRERAAVVRENAERADFPGLYGIPEDAKIVGAFGFLNFYKGFETAIQAMKHLPDDYHLAIFGGIHPHGINKNVEIEPYIRKMLEAANIGRSILDILADKSRSGGTPVSIVIDGEMRDLLHRHPEDLRHRIHFMGVQTDEAMFGAMAVCDAVVLPYMEVGQSGSGPITMAMEMGCRVIASRTKTFLAFEKYHRGEVEFFDIGNHVELAQRIMSPPMKDPRHRVLKYNTETNVETYLAANPRLKASFLKGLFS